MNTDKLKILEKNETGYGVLIENDAGVISPYEERNKPFMNEMKKITEGEDSIIEEPLILYVVLQKHGVQNRNGRIYPKDVLQREVENYQELVNDNRATGECVPAGTEIYTTNEGWKRIEEIGEDEEVLTLNPDSNQLENQKVQKTTKKWYNDQMVHIWNNSKLDMMVTKNHKKVLWDRNGNPYTITAEELYDKIKNSDTKVSKSHIKNMKEGIYLDNRYTNAELVDFNDYVYCVTVPNGTWLMRYNGKVCWTHNSDHPDSSIVSLDRISHNILETWWEGATLMGKMEIIMTPGFTRYGFASCEGDRIANLLRKGIKIGVSSRGVGSLNEIEGGKKMVQDDFELICWDAVSSPSTPGSWTSTDKKDLGIYIENDIKENNDPLNDKLDEFLLNS